MSTEQPTVPQFPAVLHGPFAGVRRKVLAEGKRCAQHYLKQGIFPPPRQMKEVAAGEVVYTHNLFDFSKSTPAWRLYLFNDYISGVGADAQEEVRYRRYEAFEVFCRDTAWGALYHVVQPWHAWDVARMAARLAAVLRFWDVLLAPRYLHEKINRPYKLDELIKEIYGETLRAWCPEGPPSVREHLEAVVARMQRATREDCIEAVMRMVPIFLTAPYNLKHREVLSSAAFLRERLAALPPERFARFSSAYALTVYEQLHAWDKELAGSTDT